MNTNAMTSRVLALSAMLGLLLCCGKGIKDPEMLRLLEALSSKYAPDGRTALFNINYERQGKYLVLRGETNIPEARDQLLKVLDSLGVHVSDSIAVLPVSGDGNANTGFVNISVANLRAEPSHRSELTSQALLGTPLTVLKRQNGWYLVQTPDRYIAWIDEGGLFLSDGPVVKRFQTGEKIYFNAMYGVCHKEPSERSPVVSDLVMGCILMKTGEERGYLKVEYPDGREGYVQVKDAISLEQWRERRNQPADSLLNIATSMMGLPYLWGGTSVKNVDCSGYTKMIYFHQGLTIPRDASQQAREGILIDSIGDFEKLTTGDLLFFGRRSKSGDHRIAHVGMWIGDGQFIHASGDVHIGSIYPESEQFDAYNLGRYIMTRRYFDELVPADAFQKDPYALEVIAP